MNSNKQATRTISIKDGGEEDDDKTMSVKAVCKQDTNGEEPFLNTKQEAVDGRRMTFFKLGNSGRQLLIKPSGS